jgi:hypothetical protein
LTSKEQNRNIVSVQTDAPERGWNKLTPAWFRAPTRDAAMIAALATVAFLATLWLLAMLGLAIFDESGPKVLAALKGQSPLAMAPEVQSVTWKVTSRSRARQPLRARPQLRAAA